MAFFDRFRRTTPDSLPLESPWADASGLHRVTFESVYGFSANENIIPINRETAMSIPAIAAARNLICPTIGRMPLLAEKNNTPLPTQPPFLTQMERGRPNFDTLTWIADHLFFYGRAFLLITEMAADGYPKWLRFVPEWNAEVNDKGELAKAFGIPVGKGTYIRVNAHNEGFLNYGADLIRTTKQIERAAAEIGASPIPSIILKDKSPQGLRSEDASALVSQWTTARSKRGGSVGYVNNQIEPEVLQVPAENLLIEGQNFSVLQVARATGVPASFLEASVAGSSLTYSNGMDRNRQLIDSALMPFMTAIESTLSLWMPLGTVAEFDTSVLLRADEKSRMDMYSTAISSGVLTANEARERENLPAIEEKPAPTPQPTQEGN